MGIIVVGELRATPERTARDADHDGQGRSGGPLPDPVVLIGGLGKYSAAPYLYGAVATIDVILIATIYYTLTRL